MTPFVAAFNFTDGSLAYSEESADMSLRIASFEKSTNVGYISLFKFCIPMAFAFRHKFHVCVAAFSYAVFSVLLMVTQKKMIWIHARRIIASVQDELSFWVLDRQSKRNPMRAIHLLSKQKEAVSRGVLSSPQPASAILFSHSGPKPVSLFDGQTRDWMNLFSKQHLKFEFNWPDFVEQDGKVLAREFGNSGTSAKGESNDD